MKNGDATFAKHPQIVVVVLLLFLLSPATTTAAAAALVHFINAPKCLNRTSNRKLRELPLVQNLFAIEFRTTPL